MRIITFTLTLSPLEKANPTMTPLLKRNGISVVGKLGIPST